MKKARMNISHSRFILSKLKIFGEIVTTKKKTLRTTLCLCAVRYILQAYRLTKVVRGQVGSFGVILN